MGTPFRDTTAALERLAVLEEENQQLRTELDELAGRRSELEELAKLRTEVVALRGLARGENEGAFLRRLGEERDELRSEVRNLRVQVREQERELVRLRQQSIGPDNLLRLFERLLGRRDGGDSAR